MTVINFKTIKKKKYIHLGAQIHTHTHTDSIRNGRYGDRIPERARFFAPVQTGPGAYPASYTMRTVSFPGVKPLVRGVDHPPHLAPRLKRE